MSGDERLEVVDRLAEQCLWNHETSDWYPEESWDRLLESSCAGDPALRDEICQYVRDIQADSDGEPCIRIKVESVLVFEPERIGRYKIVRRLGEGAMGIVYEALFEGDGFSRERALKLLRPCPPDVDSEAFAKRFRAEKAALASLSHPNIVEIYEDGNYEGQQFFTMELVKGALPVDQYCVSKRLSLIDRLEILYTICTSVHVAHSNGVLHRDLKPSNILVSDQGVPKLVDFGLSTFSASSQSASQNDLPRSATLITGGTPVYMSPEQANGDTVTERSDIYGLGKVFLDVLSDCPDYSVAGDRERLTQHVNSLILRAIRPKPEERYATAEEFAQQVRAALGVGTDAGDEIPSQNISVLQKGPYNIRRAATPLVAALVIIATVWAFYWAVQATKGYAPKSGIIGETKQQPSKASEHIRSPAQPSSQARTRAEQGISEGNQTAKDAPPASLQADQTKQLRSNPASLGVGSELSVIVHKGNGMYPQAFLDAKGERVLIVDTTAHEDAFGERKLSVYIGIIDLATRQIVAESDSVQAGDLTTTASSTLEYVLVGCSLLHTNANTRTFDVAPTPPNCPDSRRAILAIGDSGSVIHLNNGELRSTKGDRLKLASKHVCYSDARGLIFPKSSKEDCGPDTRYANDEEYYNETKVGFVLFRDFSKHDFPSRLFLGGNSFIGYHPITIVDNGQTVVGIRGKLLFLADAITGKIIRSGIAPINSDNDLRIPRVSFASKSSDVITMDLIGGKSGIFQWPPYSETSQAPLIPLPGPDTGQRVQLQVAESGSMLMFRDGDKRLRVMPLRKK